MQACMITGTLSVEGSKTVMILPMEAGKSLRGNLCLRGQRAMTFGVSLHHSSSIWVRLFAGYSMSYRTDLFGIPIPEHINPFPRHNGNQSDSLACIRILPGLARRCWKYTVQQPGQSAMWRHFLYSGKIVNFSPGSVPCSNALWIVPAFKEKSLRSFNTCFVCTRDCLVQYM